MRVASIDIGTNTIELLIAEKTGDILSQVVKKVDITRLGGDFDYINKTLCESRMLRSINVLSDYSKLVQEFNVDKVKAVATSVVRNSTNSDLFLQKIFDETGLNVEIITGIDEAYLSAVGAVSRVKVNNKFCVVVDIGGGSTELSVLEGKKFNKFYSLDLGVVSLFENYITSDIPTKSDIFNIKNRISDVLETIKDQLFSVVDVNNLLIVSNAGTPSTIASSIGGLSEYNPEKVNERIVTQEELTDFFNKISVILPNERIKMFPAIEKGREDLIICGVLILREVLRVLKARKFKVSEGGLLEGLLYKLH